MQLPFCKEPDLRINLSCIWLWHLQSLIICLRCQVVVETFSGLLVKCYKSDVVEPQPDCSLSMAQNSAHDVVVVFVVAVIIVLMIIIIQKRMTCWF